MQMPLNSFGIPMSCMPRRSSGVPITGYVDTKDTVSLKGTTNFGTINQLWVSIEMNLRATTGTGYLIFFGSRCAIQILSTAIRHYFKDTDDTYRLYRDYRPVGGGALSDLGLFHFYSEYDAVGNTVGGWYDGVAAEVTDFEAQTYGSFPADYANPYLFTFAGATTWVPDGAVGNFAFGVGSPPGIGAVYSGGPVDIDTVTGATKEISLGSTVGAETWNSPGGQWSVQNGLFVNVYPTF